MSHQVAMATEEAERRDAILGAKVREQDRLQQAMATIQKGAVHPSVYFCSIPLSESATLDMIHISWSLLITLPPFPCLLSPAPCSCSLRLLMYKVAATSSVQQCAQPWYVFVQYLVVERVDAACCTS